ncbi:MAG: YdeI/OmpD-associated family protein [Aestuariivirga sp.]
MTIKHHKTLSFQTAKEFGQWLAQNHAVEQEIWVKLFKKKSNRPSPSWEECVVEALIWGWIDGLKKPLDEEAWLQRFTPRKRRSGWSRKNRDLAERLIQQKQMQPAGLAVVDAARLDGRWDAAYAGSSDFKIPDDFLISLAKDANAKRNFDQLDRKNLFAIYYRLHTAKKAETRQKRMLQILALLSRGEKLH